MKTEEERTDEQRETSQRNGAAYPMEEKGLVTTNEGNITNKVLEEGEKGKILK